MMMPLLSCSTTACSKADCLPFPKGGKEMGGVYKRLPAADRRIANESASCPLFALCPEKTNDD